MLYIIDGSSLLTTMFYANLPKEILFAKETSEKEKYYYKILKTKDGIYTNAVFGFFRSLLKILGNQRPEYLAVCWDLSRDTFRKKLYGEYKANRSETPEPLKSQFALCQEMLDKMGIKQFMSSEFEADDFCGSLSAKFEGYVPVGIMTKDNDYLQLASERTVIFMMHATAAKTEELYSKYDMKREDFPQAPERTFPFTPELIEKEFGVRACNINSLKGLMGDSSDNIKGVPGIGPVTAAALIHEYHTVDELYKVFAGADEKKLKQIAGDFKDRLGIRRSPIGYLLKKSDTELVGEAAARLSEELATIKRDIPLNAELSDLKTDINIDGMKQEFMRMEFNSKEFTNLDNIGNETPRKVYSQENKEDLNPGSRDFNDSDFEDFDFEKEDGNPFEK
jgi:DNA polymerase I